MEKILTAYESLRDLRKHEKTLAEVEEDLKDTQQSNEGRWRSLRLRKYLVNYIRKEKDNLNYRSLLN